ncbi:farnesol dehydrogenase-like isoform X2 [Bacillus rossius redtenbacheri]|uniref:farnesol dehydrogenase-like isoform X2 n=1 Tax=Bacillus rossius redtenbacheri TaxID=93214 RepID=UPI002FDEFE56
MQGHHGALAGKTGASAGIGAAVARGLVARGLREAGLVRRVDKVQELGASLDGAPGQLHAVPCDLTREEDILAAFQWVDANLGGVDVLVNNAGILHVAPLANGNPEHWREIMKVNVLALSICTREALKSMKKRKVDDGHIIHINSVAGHFPSRVPGVSMYAASKHAVTALTEGLRRELVGSGSKVKVTSVSPGVVHTDMVSKFGAVKGLQPEDVAASVIFSLSTPPHVQIHEVMLRGVPEVLPISGEQPADFPLEYQRSGPPASPPPESTRDIPPINPPESTPETPAESPPEDQAEKQPEHLPGQPTSANQEPEKPLETAEVEQPGKPPESPPESPPEKISEAPLTES